MAAQNRFAKLSDPGKESAIAGAIAAGTFEAIPEKDLLPPDAFTDPRWRIIYSVAIELRKQHSDQIVCAEAVSDAIGFRSLDREFQLAFDSTRTFDWHTWPAHADASCAHSVCTTLGQFGRAHEANRSCALRSRPAFCAA